TIGRKTVCQGTPLFHRKSGSTPKDRAYGKRQLYRYPADWREGQYQQVRLCQIKASYRFIICFVFLGMRIKAINLLIILVLACLGTVKAQTVDENNNRAVFNRIEFFFNSQQ